MVSGGDSDFYVPSGSGSSMTVFHTPPSTPPKRKLVLEVVIPIPKPVKRGKSHLIGLQISNSRSVDEMTSKPRRVRAREPSPARSDSSVSLGTHWHVSPKKKRKYIRKKPNPSGEPRKRGRPRIRPLPGKEEHTPKVQPDPVPLATPITHPIPFKPRAHPTSSAPGVRINLESARLEAIQAQEHDRGYDIYHWPTPPGSGSVKPRVGNASSPVVSPFEPRPGLYASGGVGSSTGPGTREQERLGPVKPSAPMKRFSPPSPLVHDRFFPILAEPLEAELDTVGPEVNKLARLGLQTALGELAKRYEFPLDNVTKLYRSKGTLEDTERVLRQLRRTENELKELRHAAFGSK